MLKFRMVFLKMKVKNFGSLKLEIYNNYQELSKRAAEIFLQACRDTLRAKDIFSVSLSGGKTPKGLFELLSKKLKNLIPWKSVHIFENVDFVVKIRTAASLKVAAGRFLKL